MLLFIYDFLFVGAVVGFILSMIFHNYLMVKHGFGRWEFLDRDSPHRSVVIRLHVIEFASLLLIWLGIIAGMPARFGF